MGKLGLVGIAVMITCLSVASRSEAVALTYILEGTITQKIDSSHLVDVVLVGDKVAYTVVVDSATPNLTSVPGFGRYEPISSYLRIGDNAFATELRQIEIIADSSSSPQSSFRLPVSATFSGSPGSGYFGLIDRDKQAIPSSALPTVAYDFGLFESRGLSLTITNPDIYGDYSYLYGSFNSFIIVPEPGSLSLCGLLAAVCLVKRRHTMQRGTMQRGRSRMPLS